MRTFLNVPYEEKHEARRRGAGRNVARKRWFVEDVERMKPFLRWIPEQPKRPTEATPLRTGRR